MLIVLGLAAMASYMFNYQAAEDAELTGEVQQAAEDASGSGGSGGQTAGEPFVYVMEPFYRLTKSEQSSLLNVIWSYYITEDRDSNVVTVYDNATGQEIGTYSQAGMKIGEE